MRALLMALVLCSASALMPARAAASGPAANAPEGSLQQTLMTHALVLRGQIDGRDIQLSLQPKKNEDGLEGRYFFFGGSPEILVAGEVDGDDLLMEESVNGKDVSGQWEGHRQGQSITGTWSSADGSVSKPFALQLPGRSPGSEGQMTALYGGYEAVFTLFCHARHLSGFPAASVAFDVNKLRV